MTLTKQQRKEFTAFLQREKADKEKADRLAAMPPPLQEIAKSLEHKLFEKVDCAALAYYDFGRVLVKVSGPRKLRYGRVPVQRIAEYFGLPSDALRACKRFSQNFERSFIEQYSARTFLAVRGRGVQRLKLGHWLALNETHRITLWRDLLEETFKRGLTPATLLRRVMEER